MSIVSCPSCAAVVEPGAASCPRCRAPLPVTDDVTRMADAGDADQTHLAASSRPSGSSRQTATSSSGWLSSSDSIDHGRFPPGAMLGGRYRIVGRLGKGGMGEVYRADDLKLVVIAAITGPVMYVFLRFGLVSLATVLLVNQALANAPLTADLTKPHAAVASWTMLVLVAVAAWAFHTSKAGRGLFKGVMGT